MLYSINLQRRNNSTDHIYIPLQLINDRTMFPMREFAERTGAKVSWQAPTAQHKTRAEFEW